MTRKKGQMFLIATIFILIGFFTIRSMLGIYDFFEEKRSLEIITDDLQARNIEKEYEYVAGIASMQSNVSNAARDYLFNFSSFVRDFADARSFYFFAYSNSTTGKYTIVLGNFLNDNMNVSVAATNSEPPLSQFTLSDRKNYTEIFGFTSNGTVSLTITYTTMNDNKREVLNLTVRDTTHFFAIFTDIKMEENNIRVRRKNIYNRTWRVP